MAALHTLSRRGPVVVLLGVLVAFDAVAVAVAYVLAHVAAGVAPLIVYQYEHLFWSFGFDIVPLWPVVLVGTPVVLLCQSVFGYRLSLREADGRAVPDGSPESVARDGPNAHGGADELRGRVERLAQQATMKPPSVTVVNSETPNSYVISRPGDRTLVATTALLADLDGDELDAVLAHELAHLKNGDAFVMTAAAFLPTVSRRFIAYLAHPFRNSFIGQWVAGSDADDEADDGGDWGAFGQGVVALALFAVVAVPVTAVLYLASTACYRLLSRIREYAADAGSVAICGSPGALASALERLTENPRPKADLRTADIGTRELCVVPYAIEEPDGAEPTTHTGRVAHRLLTITERCLPGSHPDPDDRIAALRRRASDSDRRDTR